MTLTFDLDEVAAALRKAHPEIPADAKIRMYRRPGNGPGYVESGGQKFQPFVDVEFDLPEPDQEQTDGSA